MTTADAADAPFREFTNPDALDERSAFWVRFLDVMHAFDAIRCNHRRTVELLGLRQGFALLDVGCGTGNYACDVAPLVAPSGRVVGVDLSDELLAVAGRRAAERGLAIHFRVADALDLPFPDGAFDGCRTERVLQYLTDPGRAVAEMARVTQPGGRVVATEADWDGITWDCPGLDRGAWRRAITSISDGVGNGWMGREVRRVFLDAGLADVTCEGFILVVTDATVLLEDMAGRLSLERARDAGAITADEAARILDLSRAADRSGQYLCGIPLYTVSGRAP